ncbi:MAG: diversity-generating retroelement protein Avd [Saprospiraceae bacterium]|nr:diversity-generating retroelement protein Avd [Saprospiraceae bacterium]
MQEKETVVTHTYDLLLYLVPRLVKFPRHQKFVLADRIQNLLTDILQMLVEAYFSRAEAKKHILQRVNLELEKLRYLVRLAKDLHCLDLRRYEYVQDKINNIGAQVGAWLKSLP